jgi:hypothetical protein
MCMQCVAQSAPFVGVAVTMLNRRNIRHFVGNALNRAPGPVPQSPCPAAQDPAFVPTSATASLVLTQRSQDAAEQVTAGV